MIPVRPSLRNILGHLACAGFFCLAAGAADAGQQVRIKDLTNVRGVRSNPLNGLGLVVGLKGTGDSKKSLATNRAVANMFTRMGMKTKPEEVTAGNMAVVMVTTELPPFARIGTQLDVKVAVIGDAKSLAGGTLILTPLSGGDSHIYAMAQGAVVVGQAKDVGASVLTVARVPQGAVVEREFAPIVAARGIVTLSLREPDFTVASRIAEKINARLKGFFASPKDVATVDVQMPPSFQGRLVDFMAELEAIPVEVDSRAVVVLNERTGTVVMGQQVVIQPVAIAHGDLAIKVQAAPNAGKSRGDQEKLNRVVSLPAQGSPGATVGDLIETLNALGVKPSDLIGILQTLHAAGALEAELRFL